MRTITDHPDSEPPPVALAKGVVGINYLPAIKSFAENRMSELRLRRMMPREEQLGRISELELIVGLCTSLEEQGKIFSELLGSI